MRGMICTTFGLRRVGEPADELQTQGWFKKLCVLNDRVFFSLCPATNLQLQARKHYAKEIVNCS